MIQTKTVKEVAENLIASFESNYGQTIPLAKLSFFRVVSWVMAAVFVSLYHLGAWVLLQRSPRFASYQTFRLFGVDFNPLIELGRRWGVVDPFPATQATVVFGAFAGDQPGSMNVGDTVRVDDTGVIYRAITSVSWLASESGELNFQAIASGDAEGGDGSGTQGNAPVSSTATPIQPKPLAQLFVSSIADEGTDKETEESYRQRVVDRGQKRPQGGAPADIELWGEETAGVAAVRPYRGLKAGEVDAYVEADTIPTNPDGIPSQALLDEVLANITYTQGSGGVGLATRRPTGQWVNTIAINRLGVTMTVAELNVGDPVAVQQQAEEAVDEYLRSREPFILGNSIPPAKNNITRSTLSSIIEDIVALSGGSMGATTMSVEGVAVENYALDREEMAKLESITWL